MTFAASTHDNTRGNEGCFVIPFSKHGHDYPIDHNNGGTVKHIADCNIKVSTGISTDEQQRGATPRMTYPMSRCTVVHTVHSDTGFKPFFSLLQLASFAPCPTDLFEAIEVFNENSRLSMKHPEDSSPAEHPELQALKPLFEPGAELLREVVPCGRS